MKRPPTKKYRYSIIAEREKQMKLYEIEREIEEALIVLFESTDEETGEVNPEAVKKLEELKLDREQKLENIACAIKNLESDAKALKDEEAVLNARRKALENKVLRLKNYLEQHLSPEEKITSSRAVVSFRKSKKVLITNSALIPKRLLRIKTEPDKVAIKDEFTKGKKVKGCEFVDNYSLQIK